MYRAMKNRGFTLIEMSIVLLIIALIAAGILMGQSMIRQSQVMSVIVDEQQYVRAAKSFRDKYNALPGDMSNATSYWGTMSGTGGAGGGLCGPSFTMSSVPQIATCNGNGNGLIDGTGTGEGSNYMWEMFGAWQELANAGLIQGSYTGTGTYGGSWATYGPGTNAPASRLPGATWEWAAYTTTGRYGNPTAFYSNATILLNQQYLQFGTSNPSSIVEDLFTPVLSGAEALSLDLKLDDGNPLTGIMIGGGAGSGYQSCVNSVMINGLSPTGYNLTKGSLPVCYLLFQVNW